MEKDNVSVLAGIAAAVGVFRSAALLGSGSAPKTELSARGSCNDGALFLEELGEGAPPQVSAARHLLQETECLPEKVLGAVLPAGGAIPKQGYPRLTSLFDLAVSDQGGKKNKYTAGARSVERLFPEKEGNKGCGDDLRKLWNSFLNDVRALGSLKPERWQEALLATLLQYGWCVPAHPALSHVSVYDLAILAGAATAALKGSDGKDLILVSGDVSGIQGYIFDLKRENVKRAARLLRARSFDVQMLSEASVRLVCDAVGLTSVQAILNAGGRFLLILPDTELAREGLEDAALKIEKWCVRRYSGQLTVAISEPIPCSVDTLECGGFSSLITEVHRASALAKRRRHQRYLKEGGDWNTNRAVLSYDYEKFAADNSCPACGVRPTAGSVGDQESLCDHCSGLASTGRRLPHTDRLAWCRGATPSDKAGSLSYFNGEWSCLLLGKDEVDPPTAASLESITGYRPGCGRRTILHRLPVDEGGRPSTFEDMAEEGVSGTPLLGMLKADADEMGKLFTEGLGKQFSALSLMGLSRVVNEFFTEVLQELLEKDFPAVYAVFGGGDDICLIGPWMEMISLAPILAERYSRYAGGNNGIHLSAGLALAGSTLPVPAMAREAEDALDAAKSTGRNRFTAFGVTIPWNNWAEVEGWVDFFQNSLDEEILSRGFIRSLLDLRRAALVEDQNRLIVVPWRSHLRYMIGRQENLKQAEEARRRIESLAAFGEGMEREWANLKAPISLVLYRNRQGGW